MMHPNIKYELLEFDQLLSVSEAEGDASKKGTSTYMSLVRSEVERIKQTFVHEVFSFEDERHLERYIQYHQQALIRLMDKCALVTDNETNTSRPAKFIKLYEGLEELLAFVERHFTKYFDQDAKAPEGYVSIARQDVGANMPALESAYSNTEASDKVIGLLFDALNLVASSGPNQGITYKQVMYVKEVQKELFRLLAMKDEVADWDDELRQIMYYLNYNTTQVLTYHAHYISSLLEQTETRAEKIEKLSYVLKKINQAQVKPGFKYEPHGLPLKEQLNIYITEEIDYQERLQRLSADNPSGSTEIIPPGFKLKFEASVSQLAYLLKMLMDLKIILNTNLSQLVHFLVRFVITRRQETISYGSFRSKYYTVEDGTKQAVRSVLVMMIRYIDQAR